MASRASSPDLVARLLAWYDQVARPLPWRGLRDAWPVWVSEIMLQQTQVATVVPYYQRFIQRYATVQSMAAASLDEVLTLWQGLGYYRRAANLHQAACQVVEGGWPDSAAEWRRLPGVGEYTAAAIASIVLGEPVAAIDGNAERVVCRLFAVPGDPRSGPARQVVRRVANELVPRDRPGDFNQGVMELGATVCTRQPACTVCPLATSCKARARSQAAAFPERRRRPEPRRRLHAAAIITRDNKVLLGRRPMRGRWAGLWELPRVELEADADGASGLAGSLPQLLGVAVTVGQELGRLRHAVSGETIELVAYSATVADEPVALEHEELAWLDARNVAMPIWQRRLLERCLA